MQAVTTREIRGVKRTKRAKEKPGKAPPVTVIWCPFCDTSMQVTGPRECPGCGAAVREDREIMGPDIGPTETMTAGELRALLPTMSVPRVRGLLHLEEGGRNREAVKADARAVLNARARDSKEE
ncbi:MAG: hypothetical protein IH956_01380 [Chloroflexi bacterium]|nr:hypothetical protein [Chloroflexota bacterium]